MISTNVRMALTSIKASKIRSILTTLGVVIGVSSVVITVGLAEGFRNQVVNQIDQLGENIITVRSGQVFSKDEQGQVKSINLNQQSGASTLTEADVASLAKIAGVDKVVPNIQISGVITSENTANYSGANIIGTTGDMKQIIDSRIAYGDFFEVINDEKSSNVAILGSNVVSELFDVRDPIGQTITIRGQTFIVRGVIEPFKESPLSFTENLNNTVYVPYSTAQKITNNNGQITSINVKIADNQDRATVVANIEKELLINHKDQEDFSVIEKSDFLSAANSNFRLLTAFVVAIAGTSLIVGGIGIMNIMLVGVSERTKEIGVRKAVGATNQQILSQFLVEATVISVIGGFLGVFIALLATYFIKIWTSLDPVISLITVGLALLVSIVVGIVFGIAPAIQAARKDPIESLRHE